MSFKLTRVVVFVSLAAASCADTPPPAEETDPVQTDWRSDHERTLGGILENKPEVARRLLETKPLVTRVGTLRFRGDIVRTDEATTVFVSRLLSGRETPQVRAALAEALARTTGDIGPAISYILEDETDDGVRAALAASLQRDASAEGRAALTRAMTDSSPAVRVEAVISASRRSDARELGAAIVARLSDRDVSVQAQAARAVGNLGATEAPAALIELTSSSDATVRLEALRALSRIDQEAALDAANRRAGDEDPRIQRLVGAIASKTPAAR